MEGTTRHKALQWNLASSDHILTTASISRLARERRIVIEQNNFEILRLKVVNRPCIKCYFVRVRVVESWVYTSRVRTVSFVKCEKLVVKEWRHIRYL